jgi:hypothetical protein
MKPDQVDRLASIFEIGFFIQRESIRSAFKPPHQFNIIDEQSALKADFWMLKNNAFEQSAFNRRMNVDLFGVKAWIATAEDIILHKLYWNGLNPSERQLHDVAGVFSVQTTSLDAAYIDRWAAVLGVEIEWNNIRSGKIRPKQN